MKNNTSQKPNIFIRLDVAHFTNLICKWPEISRLRKRTKEFFIKAILVIAQSPSMTDIEKLLKALVNVSLSETEGISIATGIETACERSEKFLAGIDVTVAEENVQSEDNDVICNNQSEALNIKESHRTQTLQ